MNVLCLKLRNRHAVWNPATSPPYFEDSIPSELGYASIQKKLALKAFHRKKSKPPRKMSPPLPITEDTPPDMLAGAMDLHVVLPNGQDIKMSVERSTPMMDLLVHITTANKISPGGHVIQAMGDRGVLPYKPSTPIGALDTWMIHIVPKKQSGNMYAKKPSVISNSQNTPFEQTFRLQVNLPRNQLYVSRVSYKTRLEDILREVCKEKNLDQSKYCLVHPEKLDEELNLSHTFLECKLQQVTLLSKSNRPVGLSSVDIMALKRYDNENQHVNNKYYASHSYDGSVSSGSLEGRSLSPVRSDESSSSPTIPKTNPLLTRPFRKRRPAPKPPNMQNCQETKHVSESLTISHSRNSSDSSGYHESSVLSESPESNTNSLADSLPRRSKLPGDSGRSENISQHPMPNSRNSKIGSSLSRSLSNLAVVDDGKKPSKSFLSNGIRRKEYSVSSLSLANIPGKKKKAPAPPPPASKSLLSLKEEDMPNSLVHLSASCEQVSKCQTLPAIAKPSMCDAEINCSNNRLRNTNEQYPSSCTVNNCSFIQNTPVDEASSSLTVSAKNTVTEVCKSKEKELTMDDEEIDRIFHDATKGYESPPFATLPSPPESLANNELEKAKINANDPYNWEYKLPSPPKAFRDQTNSPSLTEYDTITISNLTDSLNQNRLSSNETENTNTRISNIKSNFCSGEHNGVRSSSDNVNSCSNEKSKVTSYSESRRIQNSTNQVIIPKINVNVRTYDKINNEISVDSGNGKRTNDKKFDSCDGLSLSCDKSSDIDSNYTCTNDSGLGSDDSIPSVSECKSRCKETNPKRSMVAQTTEKRSSILQNFTITTYQNTKPTEIFHDDSVKTSKTTQLAKNNRPFVKLSGERINESSSTGLSRHSSFNKDKTPNSAVKRSKSHISLLSGNFSKFNRLGKLNVEKYSDETDSLFTSSENISSYKEKETKSRSLPNNNSSMLRRTTSEVSVNKDTNREGEELLELQDQVLKWKENEKKSYILNSVKNTSELQSLQVLKDILPQIQDKRTAVSVKTTSTMEENDSTNLFKVEVKPKASFDQAPAVNLQSWNERPKRQVSIKTDRDYVFGNNRKNLNSTDKSELNNYKVDGSNEENDRVKISINSNHNLDVISRVPIVRAVEFKKPFVHQSTTNRSYFSITSSKSDNQRIVNEIKSANSIQRPSSCYLFGEHLSTKNLDNEMQGEKECTLSYVESRIKTKDSNDMCQKNDDKKCTGVSKTQIIFNGSTAVNLPDNSSKRFSYTNGISNETINKMENYTFKTYKNKLMENEKLSNGYYNHRTETENENRLHGNYSRKSVVSVNSEKVHDRKSVFRSFGKPDEKEIATTRSVGIPPPPPVMPVFRPVNQKKINQKTYINENPRDMLLSSIKNFNRDNLRKLRVK